MAVFRILCWALIFITKARLDFERLVISVVFIFLSSDQFIFDVFGLASRASTFQNNYALFVL